MSLAKKKKLSTDNQIFCHLSEDVLLKEIVTKLPVKSIARFKCVSKSWLARTSTQSFITDNFHHHNSIPQNPSDIIVCSDYDKDTKLTTTRVFLIDHDIPVQEIDVSYINKRSVKDQFNLLGSSNGLILMKQFFESNKEEDNTSFFESDDDHSNANDSRVVLWNPATREFSYIPSPPAIDVESVDYGFHRFSLGFGKDCNDFKVVRTVEIQGGDYVLKSLHLHLFTRNTGFWRQVKVISDYTQLLPGVGVVLDQIMHWPVLRECLELPAKGSLLKILTFDLNTEELKEMDGPISNDDDVDGDVELFVWNGSLAASMTRPSDERCNQFWLMSKGLLGWTKTLGVSKPCEYFKGVFRDQLLHFNDLKLNHKKIPVGKPSRLRFCYGLQHYKPSLISPCYKIH